MQNSIEMIGFCFFILYLLFMLSPRHLLIFSSGIKVIDKLFEEKLAKMLFFSLIPQHYNLTLFISS